MRYFIYTPLRARLRRRTAAYLAFLGSGLFLHDIPFNFTADLWRGHRPVLTTTSLFAIFGMLALLADWMRVDLRRQSPLTRAMANVGWLVAGFALARLLNPA